MNESQAIELALKLHSRHIVPADDKEWDELAIIQVIGDIYKAGYEVVPAKRELKLGDVVSKEELGQMLADGVIY